MQKIRTNYEHDWLTKLFGVIHVSFSVASRKECVDIENFGNCFDRHHIPIVTFNSVKYGNDTLFYFQKQIPGFSKINK